VTFGTEERMFRLLSKNNTGKPAGNNTTTYKAPLDPEIDRVELHDRSKTIADRLDF